jgi:hypothetical protein
MSDFAWKAPSCGAWRKMLEELSSTAGSSGAWQARFCWGIAFAAQSVLDPNTWKCAFPSQPISGASRYCAWITSNRKQSRYFRKVGDR